MKYKVKIGEVYNFWEVLESSAPKVLKVLCLCQGCSKIHKKVSTESLVNGRSKSCGCKSDRFRKNEENNKKLIGQVFGNWKVVGFAPNSVNRLICKCLKCNVEIRTIRKHEVIQENRKSCGCKINEHRKGTMQKLYGVSNYSHAEDFVQKCVATSLEKYGAEHFSKTNDFKRSMKEKHIEKYGCYYTQTEEFLEKSKASVLNKYGVNHNNQRPEYRFNLRDWMVDHPEALYASASEKELLNFILNFYPSAHKLHKEHYELDIFIPELNVGIEFNGLYYHNEQSLIFRKKDPKQYHLDKTKFFKGKGIRVIHIWEHEWKYKQEQTKSFLLSALGKNEYRLNARECIIVWSDSKEEIKKAHDLLDSTHIQGYTNSTKYVANIYHDNELIATATFGKHHRDSKTWILSRFTTRTNYTIRGVLSKISKLASKQLRSDIISWADYRLSNGNGYEKAGWMFEELLPPDYFYQKGLKVFSKQSRQKKLIDTPEGMTESEHAKLDGLQRVWDCGKIRYKLSGLRS